MKRVIPALLSFSAFCFLSGPSLSGQSNPLKSPEKGVLCDQYFCADRHGISGGLTTKYLGAAVTQAMMVHSTFNPKSFIFSNGIACEIEEQRCYEAQYRDTQRGKRNRVSLAYTTLLFGGPSLNKKRK